MNLSTEEFKRQWLAEKKYPIDGFSGGFRPDTPEQRLEAEHWVGVGFRNGKRVEWPNDGELDAEPVQGTHPT